MLLLINILKLVGNLKQKGSSISLVENNMMVCLPESLVFLSENMKPHQLLEKYFVKFIAL